LKTKNKILSNPNEATVTKNQPILRSPQVLSAPTISGTFQVYVEEPLPNTPTQAETASFLPQRECRDFTNPKDLSAPAEKVGYKAKAYDFNFLL
jgi:hypothetical protein